MADNGSSRQTIDCRAPAPDWVTEFCDWMAEKIEAGDMAALSDYRARAPHAVQNHPSDEHLLPLFVALGATDSITGAVRLNHVMTYGLLAMDAWLFDPLQERAMPANKVFAGSTRSYRPSAISFNASGDKLTSGTRCALSRFT